MPALLQTFFVASANKYPSLKFKLHIKSTDDCSSEQALLISSFTSNGMDVVINSIYLIFVFWVA